MDENLPHDAGITELILSGFRNCFHRIVGLSPDITFDGVPLVLFPFIVSLNLTGEPIPFFAEWILNAFYLIHLCIPFIQLLYRLFHHFSPREDLNRDDEELHLSQFIMFFGVHLVGNPFIVLRILAPEHMPCFAECILDPVYLFYYGIPVILLLQWLFRFISLIEALIREAETENISAIKEGLFSDEAVNTEFDIPVHDSASDSISDTAYFSPWERGACIGAGGYGIVYVARNSQTGDLCAVKELKNIENEESIRKEIKILCQLEHPNIVKYYACEIDGHKISLYMEFIERGSLKKYMKERGPLCEPLIRKFTAQILSGLVYLHSKRIVHRDLKPDNILVDFQDIVKLVDFGVSKRVAESVGNHSEWGTPYYAAPEVLQKKEYNSLREAYAADIWSLGCVIIEMFSGKHPWPDVEPVQAFYNVAVKEQRPPMPEKLCGEGKDFLELCFISTPADRPSAAELQDHPFVKPHLSC